MKNRYSWILLIIITIIGAGTVLLFILNLDTPVGASWGVEAGTRNSLANWLNLVIQALVLPLLATILGILVVTRQPSHPIGWSLIALGIIAVTMSALSELSVYSNLTREPALALGGYIAWVQNWVWIILFGLLLLTLALFPGGYFLNHRWKLFSGVSLLLFTVPLLVAAMIETPMSSAYQIPNPFVDRHYPTLYDALFMLGVPFMPISGILVLAQMVARYRSTTTLERQQIKWLVATLAGFSLVVVVGLVLVLGLNNNFGAILINASAILPLLGIGIAALRYRLYDIDLVIRRTLVYVLVTGLLILIYFGSVVLLQSIVSTILGQQSALVIVISTLLIAAMFNPLRNRVQYFIDRRFYRRKYDAQKALETFAAISRSEMDLDQLSAQLISVVEETMSPEHVSLKTIQHQSTSSKQN